MTIHHYLDGTTTKIAEDENLEMDFGDTFEVTTLMDANNKIKVNDVEQTGDRESISTEKYSFKSASIDNELTVDANGKVTGEFVKGMEDIIYYYSINTFTVTGEVYDGNASIKIGTNEIISKKDAPQTSKTY